MNRKTISRLGRTRRSCAAAGRDPVAGKVWNHAKVFPSSCICIHTYRFGAPSAVAYAKIKL